MLRGRCGYGEPARGAASHSWQPVTWGWSHSVEGLVGDVGGMWGGNHVPGTWRVLRGRVYMGSREKWFLGWGVCSGTNPSLPGPSSDLCVYFSLIFSLLYRNSLLSVCCGRCAVCPHNASLRDT